MNLKNKTLKGCFKAIAALLCAAVIFSVGAIAVKKIGTAQTKSPVNTALKSAVSYNSVYNEIKKLLPTLSDRISSAINGFSGIKPKNAEAIEDFESATATAGAGASGNNHSETTIQVEGVDEADVVKTDGKYIYILNTSYGNEVKIVDIRGEKPIQLGSIKAEIRSSDIYLCGERLLLIGYPERVKDSSASYYSAAQSTATAIYDISEPSKPIFVSSSTQSGILAASRVIGGKLYVITNYDVDITGISKYKPETFVPEIGCENYNGTVAADTVCFYGSCTDTQYTVIAAYETGDGSLISTKSVLGGSYTVYASTENIITASGSVDGKTQLARFSVSDGNIVLQSAGEISGELLNQFSIDEYKGYFRFVTTVYRQSEASDFARDTASVSNEMTNSLIILDGDLKPCGSIENIAPDERVYSVRFMGDTAYFVTFRRVDPLFSVDVSNPEKPEIIGSLKIPGFSDYLFPYGDGRLLGIGQNADENTGRTRGMKLSMFDISNPAAVTEYAKTDIGSAVYSEALYNHKASLTDYEKNLIGFPIYEADKTAYCIFSFEDGAFKERARIKIDELYGTVCRGLYSGEAFYVVTGNSIFCLDLSTLRRTYTLKLN